MFSNQSDISSFFVLLRYSVHASDEWPEGMTEECWENIYEMARQQSLLGVLFYGIQNRRMNHADDIMPERRLLLKWYLASERIKQENIQANKVVVKVERFFQMNGFRSCILKGQGNSLIYPNPYIRMSGDIDIWLNGGRKKILNFVNERWKNCTMRYHHVEIPNFEGIPVEVHFTPSFMNAPWLNYKWQQWFKEHAEAQFSHVKELPDGRGMINTPTLDFNLIYQMNHIYRHLFSEGIGLRQLMDYYFLLKANKGRCRLDDSISDLGMRKFAGAMMWVLREVFGLEDEKLLVRPNEKEGRFLLREIMIGGNFGQYDMRLGKKDGEGIVRRYFRMTIRNLQIAFHYPAEALCEPVFRTWYFFWRMWHKH